MTSITTKKAVYVRGPNNIYRRKTEPIYLLADTDSELAAHKKQVDRTLDDLMVCGFVEPTAAATVVSDGKQLDNSWTKSRAESTSELRGISDIRKFMASLSRPKFALGSAPEMLSGVSSMGIVGFLAPFVLGMATTLVLQRLQPTIFYYGAIGLRLLKFGLLYLAILLAVCWYFGAMDIASWRTKVVSAFQPVSLQGASDHPRVSPHSTPQLEPVLEVQEKRRSRSPSPKRKPVERVTNVRPFATPLRNDRSSTDAADLRAQTLLKFNSDITRDKDSRPRSRPESTRPIHRPEFKTRHTTDPYIKGAPGSRRHSALSLESDRSSKPLPPVMPQEADLPMVNEVRLLSLEDDDDAHDDEFESASLQLDRQGTAFSKRSVLGTRANYLRFLANVNN